MQCRWNHSSHPMHSTQLELLTPSSLYTTSHIGHTVLSDVVAAFCWELLVVCFLCFALAFFAAFCCLSSSLCFFFASLASARCQDLMCSQCLISLPHSRAGYFEGPRALQQLLSTRASSPVHLPGPSRHCLHSIPSSFCKLPLFVN